MEKFQKIKFIEREHNTTSYERLLHILQFRKLSDIEKLYRTEKMPIRFNQKKRNSYQTQICIQAQYNIHYN